LIDRAMVRSIHEVGKIMGIKTLAEYVENEAIFNLLLEIGVDFVQGRHIREPKPLESIIGAASKKLSYPHDKEKLLPTA